MKSPPFCPRPECTYHLQKPPNNRWFCSAGTYHTLAFGTVHRFRCRHCGKYFSTQTFCIDYYAKKRISYARLFNHLITTSSIRDMAREFSVSVDTVLNRLSRLSRNCLSALQELQRSLRLKEDLAADGFESFTVSQYFPCHINLLVGSDSQLVYWFDYVTLRRKGRMTEDQKRRREALERSFRADPKGVQRSFGALYTALSHLICDGSRRSAQLTTDEHPAYKRAASKHCALGALTAQQRFSIQRVSSRIARNRLNPLFSVNYLDRQLRKDLAEHVRQTMCFGRNVSRALDRLAIYVAYHNLKKPYREVKADLRTHAEVAGLGESEVRSLWYGMFTRRAFYSRVLPEGRNRKLWLREYQTPLKQSPEYRPQYVAA